MPPPSRRNPQTTPHWAEQVATADRRYAYGAVAAVLVAYLATGQTSHQTTLPAGATLVTGLEAFAPPRPVKHVEVLDFLDAEEVHAMTRNVLPEITFRPPPTSYRGASGYAAKSGWCTGVCDQNHTEVHTALDRIAQAVGHVDRNASEQAHFLDLGPGQQYGVRHDYVHDQVLSAAVPRLYSAIVFLDDAQSEGELWFPDLAVTITPKAGALVLFANVRRDDYLCPVPLTVGGRPVLVGFAPLAPSVFCAARQNAVLRRSPLRHT